jgi:hypothetical protein
MTAPAQAQAGGYTLTPAALHGAGIQGVTIEDIGRALRTPTDRTPTLLGDGRCSTTGRIAEGRSIRMVLHPLSSRIERITRA